MSNVELEVQKMQNSKLEKALLEKDSTIKQLKILLTTCMNKLIIVEKTLVSLDSDLESIDIKQVKSTDLQNHLENTLEKQLLERKRNNWLLNAYHDMRGHLVQNNVPLSLVLPTLKPCFTEMKLNVAETLSQHKDDSLENEAIPQNSSSQNEIEELRYKLTRLHLLHNETIRKQAIRGQEEKDNSDATSSHLLEEAVRELKNTNEEMERKTMDYESQIEAYKKQCRILKESDTHSTSSDIISMKALHEQNCALQLQIQKLKKPLINHSYSETEIPTSSSSSFAYSDKTIYAQNIVRKYVEAVEMGDLQMAKRILPAVRVALSINS